MRESIALGLALLLAAPTAGCGSLTATAETSRAELDVDAAEVLLNGRQPLPGVLTGGQPTPGQLSAMRDLGVATVVNLRPDDEPGTEGEEELVAELGMRYVHIPVAGAAGLTEANARALAAELERGDQSILIHCASGNRVGGLFALKAWFVDGASAAEALEIGLGTGLTRLEPAVRAMLEEAEAARAAEQVP